MRRLVVVAIVVAGCTTQSVDLPPSSTEASTTTSTTSTSTTTTSTTSTTTTTTSTTTTTTVPPTTTTPPAPTTTRPAPAASQPTAPTETVPAHCRPQMFTSEVRAQLAKDYPGRKITAHVYDTRTQCSYSLNPSNRQNPASVFKVMVMAGTLLEAQKAGRTVTDWEMSQMTPMITQSTNEEVRSLWSHFGGSPWFRTQGSTFGLSQTKVVGDAAGESWGNTQTSARDQVHLLRQVLLGHSSPLNADSRQVAYQLMTSVVPSQRWGVTAGVPGGWTVAQKNGFAGVTTNSVGWVDEPGASQGYVIAILTRGWSNWQAGIPAVERISRIVAETMTDPTWTAP